MIGAVRAYHSGEVAPSSDLCPCQSHLPANYLIRQPVITLVTAYRPL